MSDVEKLLALYEAQLEQLRAENEQLRQSAQAFGELAERLNRALLIASALQPATSQQGGYSPPPPPPPSHPASPALQSPPLSPLKTAGIQPALASEVLPAALA
jgi:hypothetical protein